MAKRDFAAHARVTAICVNLALDGVEQVIRDELEAADSASGKALARVLRKIREQRLSEAHPRANRELLI